MAGIWPFGRGRGRFVQIPFEHAGDAPHGEKDRQSGRLQNRIEEGKVIMKTHPDGDNARAN
jgi:hypothetical protein